MSGLDREFLRAAIYATSVAHDWEHVVDREDRTEEIADRYDALVGAATPARAPLTWTVEEAGRLLGIGRNGAYDAARRGEIPTVRIGRRLVVPRAALAALLSAPPLRPSGEPEPGGLDVERLGLSDEQTAILREHLSSRQQTLAAFLGDVLMELGLGRATGKEYPPPSAFLPTWAHNDRNDPSGLYDDNWEPRTATPERPAGEAGG